jgi:hypothetical protein
VNLAPLKIRLPACAQDIVFLRKYQWHFAKITDHSDPNPAISCVTQLHIDALTVNSDPNPNSPYVGAERGLMCADRFNSDGVSRFATT